jgi:hypothetical protein
VRCIPPDSMARVESPGFACPLHAAEGRELGLVGGAVAADPHPNKTRPSSATARVDPTLPPSRFI